MFTTFHALTTFPHLLSYGLIAPTLLRLIVGFFRLGAGTARYGKEYKWTSILYFISSIMIIIGLYTQIAALVAILLVLFDYFTEKKVAPLSREQKALTVVMIAILVSLLFTGPGFFAFDLPL